MATPWVAAAQLAVTTNLVLLGVLAAVWGRNYLALRSKHALGLATFALLLVGENATALYYYLVDPTLSAWFSTSVPAVAWHVMLSLHLFETVALAALVRVTLD